MKLPRFLFYGLNLCVDSNLRNQKTKREFLRNHMKIISTKLPNPIHQTGFPILGFITIRCLKFRAQKLQTQKWEFLSALYKVPIVTFLIISYSGKYLGFRIFVSWFAEWPPSPLKPASLCLSLRLQASTIFSPSLPHPVSNKKYLPFTSTNNLFFKQFQHDKIVFLWYQTIRIKKNLLFMFSKFYTFLNF